MRKYILPAAALIAMALLLAVGLLELIFVPAGSAFSETENRMLAERPSFTTETYLDGSFANSMESFLSDRFPMRAGLIRASQEIRQIGNFSTLDDYLKVAENDVADMQNPEEPSDNGTVVTPRPTRTPAPTETPALPTVPPTEDAAMSPLETELFTPDPTATPAPTPTSRPTKPPADVSGYPSELQCKSLSGEGNRTVYKCAKSKLVKVGALLDAYASLLPEDGGVAFAIVPYSARANRLMTYKNPQGFTSQVEPFIHAVTADNVAAFCTVELLQDPLLNGEYVFFRSDMHWTPYGAYLVVRQMMEEAGETLPAYEDFPKEQEFPFLGTIYRDNPTKQMKDNPDTLDIVTPIRSVRVLRYETAERYKEISFLDRNASARDRYTVYLGGPGNLAVIEQTDAGDGDRKTCLLITDSYGLCAVPFFVEAYERVLLYDPRYYSKGKMGSVSDLVERYGVKDIYMIIGDSHAFNDDTFFSACNNQF